VYHIMAQLCEEPTNLLLLCVHVCVWARNALDSMAVQHKVDLQQARQQAVDEYRAKALSEETPDVSDTSLLTDTQATNAVSSLVIIITSPCQGHLGRAVSPPLTAENGLACCVCYYLQMSPIIQPPVHYIHTTQADT